MPVEAEVGIVSAGAMGSAFATIAADMGHRVTMYFHRDESLHYFNLNHRSDRLKGIDLSRSIRGTREMSEAIQEKDVLFLAVPSEKFPGVVKELRPSLKDDCYVLIGTKGLEKDTHKTMSQVFLRECRDRIDHVAVMSGPNIADQMALHRETGTVIAAYQTKTAERLQALFNTNYFRVYTEEDVVALEAWGALKNIMAFGAGIVRAQGVSSNTMALYFTRALAEMALIGRALGVQDLGTLMGLSGVGDLFLSCYGEGTRNTQAAEDFARGISLKELRKSRTLAESLYTVRVAADLIRENNLNAPITLAIDGMLYGGWNRSVCIRQIMDQEPEREQFRNKDWVFRLARIGMRVVHKYI